MSNDNKYISPLRIANSNKTGKLSAELREEFNAIDFNPNMQPNVVSLFTVLGDKVNYGLEGTNHLNITFDGKTMPLDHVARGIVSHITAGDGKPDTASELYRWFNDMAAGMKVAITELNKAKKANAEMRDGEGVYLNAKSQYENQLRHEKLMSADMILQASRDEEHTAEIHDLQSQISALSKPKAKATKVAATGGAS